MKKIFISLCTLLAISFSVLADDSLIQIKQQLEKIERDITDMQKIIFSKKTNQNFNGSIDNNQSASNEITVFDMRLRDIENELQAINLSYEDISFLIEDLKKALNNLNTKLDDSIISINTRLNNQKINTSENNKIVNLGDDNNNIEKIEKPENTLGTLKINSTDLSDQTSTEENLIYSSPEEQFQIAFDNLRSQKFEKAKSELKLFIKNHDSHELSGSAHYWLGEIFLLQKEYREAALVFAEGYQKYPTSVKSADSLYKLAETLVKIDKKEDACNTLKQFIAKYPKHKLKDKTDSKIKNLKCS